MSEQNLLPVKINIDIAEEQKKIAAWGKFGSQLYHTDLTLQAQTQQIVNKLIDPTSQELIAQAEAALAEVKKDYSELQDRRIAVTSKFDPVIKRLMQHEKSLLRCIEINQEGILKAKQKVKEAAKTEAAKAKELNDIAAQVRIYVADMHASYLNAQLKTLSDGYKYALANNLTGKTFEEFLVKLKARVNLNNRITPLPKPTFQYNTQEDVDRVVLENFNPWKPEDYVNGFELDVDAKFMDWEHALQNKAAAETLNQNIIAETEAAIIEQKNRQTTAAKLEALAVPLTDGADAKPLKEVWQIAEPTTVNEMFNIINAFAVNRALVEPQLKANVNPANIGIKQMIAALVAVKKLDENFECTGITFSKIDKL